MIETMLSVRSYADRQYSTGIAQRPGGILPEDIYGAALDSLVLVCVDCIPLHEDKMLLSRRARLPHASWWTNGGRMRKGELYQDAAARLMRAELGLSLAPARFQLLGYYSLIWDQRAQEPQDHGCHTLSVTHTIELTAAEIHHIALNDEYDGATWIAPATMLTSSQDYHPALVQMIRDLT